jgi:dihydrofolate reductase
LSRTQYFCAASLDGYIAESDDTIDWLTGYRGSYDGLEAESAVRAGYPEFYDGVGALVMGSTTYEFVLGAEWPYKGKPCWVLSTRDLPTPPGDDVDVRIVEAEAGDLHPEMLAAAGDRNLWVVGGGNVASQFADDGLLDELIVTIVPVVLGSGKPLFNRRLPGGPMQLLGTRTFDSGMVQLKLELVSS